MPPPGGLEPPTFRLTAERASQLRHGGYNNLSLTNVFIVHGRQVYHFYFFAKIY
jgi:hypothetical protein